MKKMCIYEPALCCETGLCGVNVDEELLRISTVLNTLKKEEVIIDRFHLNSTPMEFVKSHVVHQFINENGAESLPITTVDGEIVLSGRYPTNEEILTFLDLPAQILLPKDLGTDKGCCCGNSCC